MLRASAAGKTRARPRPTPRSREALLCGQVKTLLQKVDEEVVMPVRIHALLGVSRSPAQLLAPTPANTPQLGVESAAAARGEPVLPDGIKMAMSCVLEEEETLPKLQPAGKTRAKDGALDAIQSLLLDNGIERATGSVWSGLSLESMI